MDEVCSGPFHNFPLLIKSSAADATCHLFFAYLRSLSPNSVRGINGISALPLSLQALVQDTDYPPQKPTLSPTSKVVMVVDSVSPTPFSLLRRAKHFEYRDDDHALRDFSDYEDPTKALTDECQRVLKCISSTNQSTASTSQASTSLPDASWSRFEDMGFRGFGEYSDPEDDLDSSALGRKRKPTQGLRSTAQSKSHDLGRPTTPSWADFLSSGFVDENNANGPATLLLPPDKILPPIDTRRGQSSQSHLRKGNDDSTLGPGELASINTIQFDDAFWWVWISSLAAEETMERKAVFGRCALIETIIRGGKWLIMEEIVKGAAPAPEEGAYIAEKKSRFGFTTRGRFARTKSISRNPPPIPTIEPYARNNQISPMSKVSIGPDQHARIQAAAAALQQKQKQQEQPVTSSRRARTEDAVSTKTSSVFTLQPVIMSEAAPAMKWANSYDKNAIRAAYLGNNFTGKGSNVDLSGPVAMNAPNDTNGSITPVAKDLGSQPGLKLTNGSRLPRDDSGLSGKGPAKDRDLPALPPDSPKQESTTPFTEPTHMPPAPLPAVSKQGAHLSNEVATQAAMVPLPAATPMESSQNPIEKPLPYTESNHYGTNEAVQHTSDPYTREPVAGISSQPSSPESKKGNKKLAKTQGGGFKNFFGRKKSGAPNLPSLSQPADSTAVAAARAAYVGPQMKPNYNVSQTKLGRRLSGIGRPKAPTMPSASSPAVHSIQDSEEPEIHAPAPIVRPFESQHGYGGSQTSFNRVDSNEQRKANRPFPSFDQGPMMDQPAFVPESSPEQTGPPTPIDSGHGRHSVEHDAASEKRTRDREPTQLAQANNRVPASAGDYDDESESDEERSASPALDRWAQIRKNAAERAAKQNGGQLKPSHDDKTDDGDADGETSGEESKYDDLIVWLRANILSY